MFISLLPVQESIPCMYVEICIHDRVRRPDLENEFACIHALTHARDRMNHNMPSRVLNLDFRSMKVCLRPILISYS